ncbi:toxin-antitoxin system YwqK family antitoxin [Planctomycetaceae bacterium SH139]
MHTTHNSFVRLAAAATLLASTSGATAQQLVPPETVAIEMPVDTQLAETAADYGFPSFESDLLPPDRGELLVPEQQPAQPLDAGELIQQRYPDGSVFIERHVVEDAMGNLVNHGEFKEYNNKGEVVREGSYELGAMQGEWTQWIGVETLRQLTDTLDKGFKAPFRSQAQFSDNQVSGEWMVSDSAGNPVFVWQLVNGQRENVSLWYDSQGEVIREIFYSQNMPHGPAKIAAPASSPGLASTGRAIKAVQFDRGRVVQSSTEWFDPQRKTKKKVEQSMLVPLASEIASHDWWNSSLRQMPEPTSAAIRHGVVRRWYPNGQPAFVGNYKYGKQEGEFAWFYENGQPRGRGQYVNDMETGTWSWWHINGMKMAEGQYEAGNRVGIWSNWSATGQLVFRGPADALLTPSGEESVPENADSPASGIAGEALENSGERNSASRPSSLRRSQLPGQSVLIDPRR